MASPSSPFNKIVLDCGRELDAAAKRIAKKHKLDEDVAQVVLLASADTVLMSRQLDPDTVLKARMLMEESRA